MRVESLSPVSRPPVSDRLTFGGAQLFFAGPVWQGGRVALGAGSLFGKGSQGTWHGRRELGAGKDARSSTVSPVHLSGLSES